MTLDRLIQFHEVLREAHDEDPNIVMAWVKVGRRVWFLPLLTRIPSDRQVDT